MSLYNQILNRQEKIAVIGLGYVGIPLAVAFAEKVNVIGFDINEAKIETYKSGIDPKNEVGNEVIRQCKVEFTADEAKLKEAKFYIITVPTPINSDKTPDLDPVEKASVIVGRNLTEGSFVVYESTVYPGVTESVCIPILECESELKCGVDFKVGFSPERINPGDKLHRLETIVKIVSAIDTPSCNEIAKVYELVISAGVHKVSSIKVAEATKVVENSQRDVNIAFMNELAIVFDRMGIDTKEVVEAMNTKWNALKFYPGLVGGHCIGVDPYYFLYEAERLGYHSQIIMAGRKINDDMGKFVADIIIRELILADKRVKQCKVVIMGLTYKENVTDVRNSRVVDIITFLRKYGIEPLIVDPKADAAEVKQEYGIDLIDIELIANADCLVLAVTHDAFRKMSLDELDALFGNFNNNNEKVLIDVKSMLDKKAVEKKGYSYWRL